MTSDWQHRAACRGTADRHLFISDHNTKTTVRHDAEQYVIEEFCQRCPVRIDCLNFALANNEKHGVWGGIGQDILQNRRTKAAARAIEEVRKGSPCPDANTPYTT